MALVVSAADRQIGCRFRFRLVERIKRLSLNSFTFKAGLNGFWLLKVQRKLFHSDKA